MGKLARQADKLVCALRTQGVRGLGLWATPLTLEVRRRLMQAWGRFWVRRNGVGFWGRSAARFATWGMPPFYGRWPLAYLDPSGFVAPGAVLYGDVIRGRHVYVDDGVIIYPDPIVNGGPVTIGDRVRLYDGSILATGFQGRIVIGDDTHVHSRCHFLAIKGSIVIGRRVQIAAQCSLVPYNHGTAPDEPILDQPLQVKGDIVIEDDVWLGIGVTVLTGVRIGKGAVIGAGAVVTRNVPDGAIAVGVPARIVRRRGDTVRLQSLDDLDGRGVMVRALNGTIWFWNKAAEQMYGFAPQETVGHRSHDVLHTEFPVPLSKIDAELVDKGEWVGQLIHTRRDGTQVRVWSRWELQRDAQHRPLVVMEINNIAESGPTIKSPVTGSPAGRFGSWTWDLATNTMTWSDELFRLYGLNPAEFKGTYEPFLNRVPAEDRVMIQSMFQRAVKDRQPFAFLHRLHDPDGRVRTIQVHGEVKAAPNGTAMLLGGAHDVTDQIDESAASSETKLAVLESKLSAQTAELMTLRRELDLLRNDLAARSSP